MVIIRNVFPPLTVAFIIDILGCLLVMHQVEIMVMARVRYGSQTTQVEEVT